MKTRYQLTFVHKLLGFGLLAMAVLFLCNRQAYRTQLEYGSGGIGFYFLQEGSYALDIYCNDMAVDNKIIIYSDDLINDKNQQGVEFLKIDTAGKNKIHTILDLKEDVYNVRLKTTQDTSDKYYISYVELQSIQLQNRDNYLLSLFCILGTVIIFWLGWYVPKEKYIEPLMLIGFGLLASMPLFSDFIMEGDDLGYHVARINAIYKGLKAGELPVYLGSSQMGGFGMLSGTMYPQLFLYPVALLRFFRISLMMCYKLLVAGINIGSAFTAYYAAKSICKSAMIGFWASVFYTFSIYRLTNVYFRAALGESLAMVFLPLVIWGIYEVLWGNFKKWYILAFGVGGVLQSHVLSAEMCVFFLGMETVVWLICRKRRNLFGRRFLAGIKAVVMTILVNAFFLIPFLFFAGEDLQCFHMPNQLSETALYFSQMFSLFADAQGSDLKLGSTAGEMPHTIGAVLLLGAILMCVESFKERDKSPEMQVGQRCLLYGMIALFMSSWLFPWERLQNTEWLYSVITSLQFAWRFLGPASALLSVSAAVGAVHFVKRVPDCKWLYGVCAVLVICGTSYFFGMKGAVSEQYNQKMEFNGAGYTDSMYMYSDGESFKALHLNYERSDSYIVTKYGTEVEYSDFRRKGMQLMVTVNSSEHTEDYLLFPFYYYPGYVVFVDGEPVEILAIDNRVACKLPIDTADIKVYYRGMPSFAVANFVSVLTIAGIIIYNVVIVIRKNRRKKPITIR